MQRYIFTFFTLGLLIGVNAQKLDTHHINPDSSNYDNVYVKKVNEDSLQSTFIIWVKQSIQPHYHAHHSEYVQVLSGKAMMTLDTTTFSIAKGDIILIPMGAVHSVKVISRQPLKVISRQSPVFDGDRVWVLPKEMDY
jgi:quercetin dioxygenase-like cupin family protein